MLKKFYPAWQALRFMGRLLFCTQKIGWEVYPHEKSKQAFTLVFCRGISGLENRRLEREIRRNSISNFRLCAGKKFDIVIYPINPHEISVFACFFLQNLPKYITLWQILQKNVTRRTWIISTSRNKK